MDDILQATIQCLDANIAAQNLKPYFMHSQNKEKDYISLNLDTLILKSLIL